METPTNKKSRSRIHDQMFIRWFFSSQPMCVCFFSTLSAGFARLKRPLFAGGSRGSGGSPRCWRHATIFPGEISLFQCCSHGPKAPAPNQAGPGWASASHGAPTWCGTRRIRRDATCFWPGKVRGSSVEFTRNFWWGSPRKIAAFRTSRMGGNWIHGGNSWGKRWTTETTTKNYDLEESWRFWFSALVQSCLNISICCVLNVVMMSLFFQKLTL